MAKRIISEIWIYPVKSLGGIRMHSAKVLPKGLEHDRRWMLIDADNQFMTQRVFPQMALFKLTLHDGQFSIRHKDDSIQIPFSYQDEPVTATIWDDTVTVFEVSEELSNWFSSRLEMKCRLVSFPEENIRDVDPRYAIGNEQVSLADAYPVLLIGQASLNDLNHKLTVPVPMNRFRPNIVFAGDQPFEEDNWRYFKIGNNRFAAVKPCARCVLTTVDQETGIKGKEPLTTLATYRNRNGKIYFGQNVLPLDHLAISEGDELTVG